MTDENLKNELKERIESHVAQFGMANIPELVKATEDITHDHHPTEWMHGNCTNVLVYRGLHFAMIDAIRELFAEKKIFYLWPRPSRMTIMAIRQPNGKLRVLPAADLPRKCHYSKLHFANLHFCNRENLPKSYYDVYFGENDPDQDNTAV